MSDDIKVEYETYKRATIAGQFESIDACSLAANIVPRVEMNDKSDHVLLVAKEALRQNDYLFLYGEIKKANDANFLWSIPFYFDSEFVIDTSISFGHAKFASLSCKPNCSCKLVINDNSRLGMAIIVSADIEAGTPITIPNPFKCAAFCMCNSDSCPLVLPPTSVDESPEFTKWLSTSHATTLKDTLHNLQSPLLAVEDNLISNIYDSNWYVRY